MSLEDLKSRSMTDQYDHEEVVDRELWPLIKQVHERCEELGLPFFAAICYANDGDRHGINSATHFCGPERTPLSFPAAYQVMKKEELAMPIMVAAHMREQLAGELEA